MTGVWSWVKRVAQEPHHHHSRAEKLRDGKAGRVTLHYCFKTGAVGSSRALVAHIVTESPASVGTQLLHPKETWPWGCGSLAFSSWRDVTCYKLSLLISTNLFEPSRGVVLSYSSRGIFLAKVTSQTSFVGHKKKNLPFIQEWCGEKKHVKWDCGLFPDLGNTSCPWGFRHWRIYIV